MTSRCRSSRTLGQIRGRWGRSEGSAPNFFLYALAWKRSGITTLNCPKCPKPLHTRRWPLTLTHANSHPLGHFADFTPTDSRSLVTPS